MKLEAVDHADPMYPFQRFRAERDGLSFQVVAVWTETATDRRDHYKQAIEGARRFREWIPQVPTVIMGDFNDSARYRTTNWPELMEAMDPLEVASAYHAFTHEPFGGESKPTYFHHGKADNFSSHIDYCFIPLDWGVQSHSCHRR
jgi:exodeoxyribonuclease III